ncbi:hypothetical protein M4R22_21140 [Acidovorax sp. GBBC 3334]|uniref:hypothetical protein n=1 Tax=Acidovorax sp. GBBC 3334 TaxID=2940496 RepID=UPI0023028E7A|nr:hypothetical protein [Acidovorax sp. GBBC 3334]MDA8457272.1 hypothetical protein [Acidovorax sp. GBBC 3334]
MRDSEPAGLQEIVELPETSSSSSDGTPADSPVRSSPPQSPRRDYDETVAEFDIEALDDDDIEAAIDYLLGADRISEPRNEESSAAITSQRSDTFALGREPRPARTAEAKPPLYLSSDYGPIREHPPQGSAESGRPTLKDAFRQENAEDAAARRALLRQLNPQPVLAPSGYPRLRPTTEAAPQQTPAGPMPGSRPDAGNRTGSRPSSSGASTLYRTASGSLSPGDARSASMASSTSSTSSAYRDARQILSDADSGTETPPAAGNPPPSLASSAPSASPAIGTDPAPAQSAMLQRWLQEPMPPRDALLTPFNLPPSRH